MLSSIAQSSLTNPFVPSFYNFFGWLVTDGNYSCYIYTLAPHQNFDLVYHYVLCTLILIWSICFSLLFSTLKKRHCYLLAQQHRFCLQMSLSCWKCSLDYQMFQNLQFLCVLSVKSNTVLVLVWQGPSSHNRVCVVGETLVRYDEFTNVLPWEFLTVRFLKPFLHHNSSCAIFKVLSTTRFGLSDPVIVIVAVMLIFWFGVSSCICDTVTVVRAMALLTLAEFCCST